MLLTRRSRKPAASEACTGQVSACKPRRARGDAAMLRVVKEHDWELTGSLRPLLHLILIAVLSITLSGQSRGAGSAKADAPQAKAPKLAPPPILLKNEVGKNVLTRGKPISTRQSCGGDCHDYDFIAN